MAASGGMKPSVVGTPGEDDESGVAAPVRGSEDSVVVASVVVGASVVVTGSGGGPGIAVHA